MPEHRTQLLPYLLKYGTPALQEAVALQRHEVRCWRGRARMEQLLSSSPS